VRLAIAEENLPILDFHDSGIGESDTEDVRGQVLEASLGGTHGLGIDNPVDFPDLRWDLIEEAGLPHCIPEFGPEDLGEGLDREIEIDSGGMPEAIGRREGATRGDVMDMGVKLESSSPGVKDAEEAREIGADKLLVGDQTPDRF